LDDLGGMITAPLRGVRLVRITKEVCTERVAYYKVACTGEVCTIVDTQSQPEEGDGQPRQGLRGDIRGFTKGMKVFFATYLKSHVIARTSDDEYREMLNVTLTQFLDSVAQKNPRTFEPFHKAARAISSHWSLGNLEHMPLKHAAKLLCPRGEPSESTKKV